MKPFALCFCSVMLAGRIMAAEEGSFDRSVSVSGPVDLDIRTDSGGISVEPGQSSTVQIHAILKAQENGFGSGDAASRIRELERNPPVEQSGDTVRVGYVHDRNLLRGISMRFEVRTPPDTHVRARADSGGIHVEGLKGPIDCKTDSGGIQVRDIQSDVHVAADSGGIRINHVDGAVTARVDSGGVEATNVNGQIDAQADSGSVRLSQSQAAPIRAKADSGGVSVRLAKNAGYNLSIEADSGNISVPEMTVKSGFSSHHIQGQVGPGGPPVEIRVSSGNVSVQ
jgi:hypothetical protein